MQNRRNKGRGFVLGILRDELEHFTEQELDEVFALADAEVTRRVAKGLMMKPGPNLARFLQIGRLKRSTDEGD